MRRRVHQFKARTAFGNGSIGNGDHVGKIEVLVSSHGTWESQIGGGQTYNGLRLVSAQTNYLGLG